MNGILLVDKPMQWTSHDVVNFIRKRFKIKKVGHGGTLDPIATGLLVLFLGSATKTAQMYNEDHKEYLAVMALGCETVSLDGTAEVTKHAIPPYIPYNDLSATFSSFTGTIWQKPPLVSAVKHQGKRLYKRVLKGETPDPEPRKRTIFSLNIRHYNFPYVVFNMTCSRGTYVRKLCADIGTQLQCGAFMSSLVRLRSGEFTLSSAVNIDQLKSIRRDEIEKFIIPGPAALSPTQAINRHIRSQIIR